MGYSLGWHLLPELVAELFVILPSAPAALILSTKMLKQAEILLEKPSCLLYLLYLLNLPYSPPLAQLKSFQQLGW